MAGGRQGRRASRGSRRAAGCARMRAWRKGMARAALALAVARPCRSKRPAATIVMAAHDCVGTDAYQTEIPGSGGAGRRQGRGRGRGAEVGAFGHAAARWEVERFRSEGPRHSRHVGTMQTPGLPGSLAQVLLARGCRAERFQTWPCGEPMRGAARWPRRARGFGGRHDQRRRGYKRRGYRNRDQRRRAERHEAWSACSGGARDARGATASAGSNTGIAACWG